MDLIKRRGLDNFENRVRIELEGQIVMTMYNKKTYRIDDIDFSQNPDSLFSLKNGQTISYRQYYTERYQVTIQASVQPLLVSRPSRRDINRGNTEPIFLIPELCGMTGLSDEQK
jgi:aubergine-like protein